MRFSCVFVSVAVMLAQQASAAPVVGLPALPLIDGNGQLIDGLSSTLTPVPLVGNVVSNLLEAQSSGGLLSTLDVTGKSSVLNNHGLVSELGQSLIDRPVKRGEIPIVGSMLDQIPGVSQIESMLPMDSFSAPKTTYKTLPGIFESLPIDTTPLSEFTKRDAGVQDIFGNLLDNLPGAQQIQSIVPFNAIPGLDTIESLPGISQIKAVVPQVEGMVPQIGGMLPQA